MKIILLTIVNSLMMVLGQTILKIGVKNIGKISASLDSFISLVTSPFIVGGILLYGVNFVLWLYILSIADLSYVYPMQSIVFIFALLVSAFVLKESIPVNRWIGVCIIIFGVYIISKK